MYLDDKEGDFLFHKVRVNWLKPCLTLMFCSSEFMSTLSAVGIALRKKKKQSSFHKISDNWGIC